MPRQWYRMHLLQHEEPLSSANQLSIANDSYRRSTWRGTGGRNVLHTASGTNTSDLRTRGEPCDHSLEHHDCERPVTHSLRYNVSMQSKHVTTRLDERRSVIAAVHARPLVSVVRSDTNRSIRRPSAFGPAFKKYL